MSARLLKLLLVVGAASALAAAQPNPPPDLAEMMAKARVDGQIVRWCRGHFRSGRSEGYAAAVAFPAGGGRYVVFDGDATNAELAQYKGAPDLACYTPAEARKLDASIRTSETVSGRIAPVFPTTVVCGFVDGTSAICWQYSATARGFVKVGEWQT